MQPSLARTRGVALVAALIGSTGSKLAMCVCVCGCWIPCDEYVGRQAGGLAGMMIRAALFVAGPLPPWPLARSLAWVPPSE